MKFWKIRQNCFCSFASLCCNLFSFPLYCSVCCESLVSSSPHCFHRFCWEIENQLYSCTTAVCKMCYDYLMYLSTFTATRFQVEEKIKAHNGTFVPQNRQYSSPESARRAVWCIVECAKAKQMQDFEETPQVVFEMSSHLYTAHQVSHFTSKVVGYACSIRLVWGRNDCHEWSSQVDARLIEEKYVDKVFSQRLGAHHHNDDEWISNDSCNTDQIVLRQTSRLSKKEETDNPFLCGMSWD